MVNSQITDDVNSQITDVNSQITDVNSQITDAKATDAKATEAKAAGNRATKVGVVVSNKMQKTVVVAVENVVRHGMYQKYIRRTSKFLAHAEQPDINVGDRVLIEESRPLSKRKRWAVREVIERAS